MPSEWSFPSFSQEPGKVVSALSRIQGVEFKPVVRFSKAENLKNSIAHAYAATTLFCHADFS